LKRLPWRKWIRALHRDVGYLAIGLTFVYAVSGIAVNHIDDWDPNFTPIDKTTELAVDLSVDPDSDDSVRLAARKLMASMERGDAIEDVYALDDRSLEVTLNASTLFVDLESRTVREEGQESRPLLRVANWLHLNRGKKAWTYVADSYAAFLLVLATTGLFMFPLRRGLLGRGGVLTLVGAAAPILYVVLSGGP